MEKNKYTIKYFTTFVIQFKSILEYLTYELRNQIAAENFYNEVISEIEKRSKFSTAFEVYKKTKEKNVNWYKIQIKNYMIFYVVRKNVMEIRTILYNKRNLDKLI